MQSTTSVKCVVVGDGAVGERFYNKLYQHFFCFTFNWFQINLNKARHVFSYLTLQINSLARISQPYLTASQWL